MRELREIASDIRKVDAAFDGVGPGESRLRTLERLADFEVRTAALISCPHVNAVVKWYKNRFFQNAGMFQRAEELLDEALDTIELLEDPLFYRWKVKIYISLGYVHRAQWNYLDAEFYLTHALDMAASVPELSRYLGEIYSRLAQVNLILGRHHQANTYVTRENQVCRERYQSDTSDSTGAVTYAYALVNYSRIRRLMGLVDRENFKDLDQAIQLALRLDNEKCRCTAELEKGELQYAVNQVGGALDLALLLEPAFSRMGMIRESTQAALLAGRVYRRIHDYEMAEKKFNNVIETAESYQLMMEQTTADAYYELGRNLYRMDQEGRALECFRISARTGMVLGVKDIIIRAFDAARLIDKYKARELLTTRLAYSSGDFIKDRLSEGINPFKQTRSKTRLFATTLFVDIVGFSRMMKSADEALTIQMVDEFIDRMSLIIYQYNGYIDKFLGDGFMAIFEHGSSLSALRVMDAIRSGIDIYRALKHKNRKLGTVYGEDRKIKVRIGISTGEIFAMILGNYIKKEFAYLGNSVNLASKLESHASNRFMLIDEGTYEQVRDKIISEPDTIDIPGLGKTGVYKVLRLARINKRPDLKAAGTKSS